VVAGVDATLLAACQLLNNPPSSALRHLARQEGGLGVSLDAGLLLLRAVVPAMTWWLCSLRLEVAAVQQ
jgi:hypothetical protein